MADKEEYTPGNPNCKNCGEPVRTISFTGSGICSENCKDMWNEKRQAAEGTGAEPRPGHSARQSPAPQRGGARY